MRNVRPDQHQIQGLKKADVIPSTKRVPAPREIERQFDRPVVVPMVSMTREGAEWEGSSTTSTDFILRSHRKTRNVCPSDNWISSRSVDTAGIISTPIDVTAKPPL